ncbi:hypothetical protein [Aureivirga sp. CE67]|uniref:hypothetical protein n=1 Tax=Aureivirga sp. CE67 TaxID=1788983 RepID=UPI0018CACEEF|nr:hypothetical protein [Aureivirga sp. CE67]
MIINTAFTIGIISGFTIFLSNLLTWIQAYRKGRKIGEVKNSTSYKLFRKTVGETEISLGIFPITGTLLFSDIKPYVLEPHHDGYEENEILIKQRSRFYYLTCLIMLISGVILFLISTTLPFNFLISTYFSIATFQMEMSAGDAIWELFYTKPLFLASFIFISTAFSFSKTILLEDKSVSKIKKIMFYTFSIFILFVLYSVVYRLIWSNFNFMQIVYFIAGSFITSLVATLLNIVIAKIMVNLDAKKVDTAF